MASTVYIVLSLLLAAANLLLSFVVLMKPQRDARFLGVCLLCTVVVNVSYLGAVMSAGDYTLMSFLNSMYFVCIDLALLFLWMYVASFTFQIKNRWNRLLLGAAILYLAFDAIVLLSNPLTEIALTYKYDPQSAAPWRFDPYLLFNMHLYFCYFMVGMVFINFATKIASVPSVYRSRYHLNVIALMVVVLANALFLFVPDNHMLDFSVLMYSMVAFILYLTGFQYGDKAMLNRTNEMIIDGLGHPVVLFDYEDRFVFCNSAADALISPEKRNRDYDFKTFVEEHGFNKMDLSFDADVSFHCQFIENGILGSYRCDYRSLEDDKQRQIGRLFMFTGNTTESDLLTGFFTRSTFENNEELLSQNMLYPLGVAVCDINRLSQINISHGRNQGDAAVQALANLLRKHFPRSAYFVRLSEANLVVICPAASVAFMKRQLDYVAEDLLGHDFGTGPVTMQSAVSLVTNRDESISSYVDSAFASMKARKLLDGSSSHSSLLDSFAQTQRESDGETEEHVQRTQLLGEKLGERLGLSDGEQSNLALLCLLHDIGKVGIPLEILNKPGKLTDEEWEVMKSHVEKGYRIASASSELKGIANLILHHHESWDGTGYPDGLAHESIPLLSRILSVVDTYDAMTNDRPYRPALSDEEACQEIKRCAGTQFDPYIVSEFLLLMQEDTVASKVESLKEKKKPETALSNSSAKPRSVIDDIVHPHVHSFEENSGVVWSHLVPYASYVVSEDGKIIEINDEFTNITGYTREDLETYNLHQGDLIFPDESEYYASVTREMLRSNGEAFLEHRIRRKDGSTRYVYCYGKTSYDPVHRVVRSNIVIADLINADSLKMYLRRERISARRNITMLEDSARRDPLTGLFNRNTFRSEVQEHLLKSAARILIFILDIDLFKEFNDTYGHPEGDELLKVLASGLEQAVYPSGIACRMGGDEFAAAMFVEYDANNDEMHEQVQNVFDRVSSVLSDYAPGASISMGVSLSAGEQARSFTHLYHRADKALYDAKTSGRNSYRCDF